MSRRPKIRKPYHDFVFGLRGILGLGLVIIQKHIDGDISIDEILRKRLGIRRCCGLVADPIRPVHVEVNVFHALECEWYNTAVDLDVGERVNWCVLLTRGVLPCHGKFRGGGFGGISLVMKRGDLSMLATRSLNKESGILYTHIHT